MNIKHLVLAVILMLVSSMANAGRAQGHNVEIFDDHAQGNMRQARFSNNDVEHIGCVVSFIIEAEEGDSHLSCAAADSEGSTARCYSWNPELVYNMGAINTYSWVYFGWIVQDEGTLDEWNECVRLNFATRSWMIPSKVGKMTNEVSYPE